LNVFSYFVKTQGTFNKGSTIAEFSKENAKAYENLSSEQKAKL